MKYIDAEKLAKAIEDKGLDCSFALKMERLDTLALIDELQQEQQEVDLEKEYKEYVEDDPVFSILTNRNVGLAIARHFFSLGLNARNEHDKI